MKCITYVLLLCTFFAGLLNAETLNEPSSFNDLMSSYQLGPGDQIRIIVFREPDLSIETKLTDAGSIIFPFLGEISVSGLTVGALKEKITQGLSGRLIIDPIVSVSILAYREFFVNGQVKKPGAFPYFPGLTVQKAISMAEGFTERASQSSVKIIREKDISYKAIDAELNAVVYPGDVVIVEESFF